MDSTSSVSGGAAYEVAMAVEKKSLDGEKIKAAQVAQLLDSAAPPPVPEGATFATYA